MKTTPFNIPILTLFTKATCALIFISTLATASTPPAGNTEKGNRKERPAADSFQGQIQDYLQKNNSPYPNLKSGIVMVSFYLNDNNELTHVESYSQDPKLDSYLVSCLEGKTVKATHVQKNQKHYLKIRFDRQA